MGKQHPSIIDVTRPTPASTPRLPLGDPQAGTLPEGGLAMFVGPNGSGRTAAAVQAVVAAVAVMAGTKRKVAWASVGDQPQVVLNRLRDAGLSDKQLAAHVRVAHTPTLEHVAQFLALAVDEAPFGEEQEAALAIIDDAGLATSSRSERREGREAHLLELVHQLRSGHLISAVRASTGWRRYHLDHLLGMPGTRVSVIVTQRTRTSDRDGFPPIGELPSAALAVRSDLVAGCAPVSSTAATLTVLHRRHAPTAR